jgi:acetolactate synthase I/II/III large subunit
MMVGAGAARAVLYQEILPGQYTDGLLQSGQTGVSSSTGGKLRLGSRSSLDCTKLRFWSLPPQHRCSRLVEVTATCHLEVVRMKRSAADVIVRYLELEGVEYLFGVPGGHLLALYDAVHRATSLRTILAKNEQGAGYMANGYARVSGRLSACCGTVGPGATNLVSGVAAAWMDSVPMIVLTGQVGTTAVGKGALQDGSGGGRSVDHVGVLRSITKHSSMITRSEMVPEAIRRAIRIATSGRPGPVHVDLPADVLKGNVEDDIIPPVRYRPNAAQAADLALVDRAAEALLAARKPALLIGGGAVASGAHEAVLALAEALRAPVATSLRGKGIISEDHPLALGCLGLYGTRVANTYLRSGVDVLVAVGVSFHEFTTHCWDPAFQPTNALIQIDIDPGEIGKNYPVDVAIVGDARFALDALLTRVSLGSPTPAQHRPALPPVGGRSADEGANLDTSFPLKPQRVVSELRDALPDSAVVFTDIGNSLTWIERGFVVRRPGAVVSMSGLAAMGSGVAGAIGGKLAAPDRPVVCVCGDGDFQMTGMEVLTATSYGIPVVWVIMSNERLGMIHDIQVLSYQGRVEAADLRNPDFVALGRAMHADAYRISHAGELCDVVRSTLQAQRPTVIDVPIDATEQPPMKPRMLALQRSIGLPATHRSVSWQSAKALARMVIRRER